MKEFRLNKYVTLKLENNEKTMIYINNEPFKLCKSLIINLPNSSLDEIESIDDAIEEVSKNYKLENYQIPPETEFWGHCSNLQVWIESEYDTRLLQSELAFPLLEKLCNIGDPIAKIKFKEEIVKRLESGSQNVINFLYEEGFIEEFLSEEELFYAILSPEEAEVMLDLELVLKDIIYQRWKWDEPKSYIEENRHVVSLNLSQCELKEIPESVFNLKYLRTLKLHHNKISEISHLITNLKEITTLDISYNRLSVFPKPFRNLKNLRILKLNHNKISEISHLISNLKEMTTLDVSYNKLSVFPKPLQSLKSLKFVNIEGNKITNLKNFPVKEDLFIQVIISKDRLDYYIIEMDDIFREMKSITTWYLAEMLRLEVNTLKTILKFHKKEIEKNGIRIKCENGILIAF